MIQNMLGWIKVVLCAFMGLTGLYVVVFRPQNGSGSPANTIIFHWIKYGKILIGLGGFINRSFQSLYSYAGLNNVNNVLNEVKHPVGR